MGAGGGSGGDGNLESLIQGQRNLVNATWNLLRRQSAGRSDVPWLGPDVLDVMERAAKDGALGVVICPCGFVADHLEVLYDVDIECKARAKELGIGFARTASPNVDPDFLDTLAAVVDKAMQR